MFLKKNLWGLFFFFIWGTVFSQSKQLERLDVAFIDYAFADVEAENMSVQGNHYNNYSGTLNVNSEYSILLDSLTSKEKKSENFVLNILNINSKYSDYAPSFCQEKLVFSSSRDVNRVSKSFDAFSNQPFLDLYTASKEADKQRIKKLKGKINSKFHESSPVFTADGKTVYFTRNNYSNKKSKTNTEGSVLLKIYQAKYKEEKWVNIKELPFCSDEYSVAHPTLSPDGRYLYFASDMPGSLGKSDLYFVRIYKDGSFGTPQNLGNQINTDGRETFPYVSDKGKLFFASDGHLGFGGLDIFVAMPDEGGETEIYNLGEPINSPEDDFTFIINEENKIGYFASNREGGKGDDDIYGFRQLISFKDYHGRKPNIIRKLERIIETKSTENSSIIVSN
ncbi:hypothetical protein U6A24_02975 [Aquimarina gracilis]|uniref:WD40 repeat protein n=1 Tax=Aquimarina gracilis TaxID=874422 RepID=A0ABU5ZR56_9FLAO|nr:hypothetical protein [Aquimarina gracilis]MEB3344404.1 hypothetical protein [Aquimarina gracilis]